MSETDYMLYTPDQKRKTCVCHLNMLKAYHTRVVNGECCGTDCRARCLFCCDSRGYDVISWYFGYGHRWRGFRHAFQQGARLENSEILKDLHSYLNYLTMNQRINIVKLLSAFKCLFADVPTQTNVLQHDIKVIGARPIKQHAYRVNTVKDLLCVKR